MNTHLSTITIMDLKDANKEYINWKTEATEVWLLWWVVSYFLLNVIKIFLYQ